MSWPDHSVREAILAFVDAVVPTPQPPKRAVAVWLTGSRVRGDARPDSDWDVVAFTEDASADPRDLFILATQESQFTMDGGVVQLVVAHPSHWNDPRRYMTELRETGVRLR